MLSAVLHCFTALLRCFTALLRHYFICLSLARRDILRLTNTTLAYHARGALFSPYLLRPYTPLYTVLYPYLRALLISAHVMYHFD